MEMKFNVKPQTPPNFIVIDGIDRTVPVENLTEEEAKQYAQLLADNFMNHWKNKIQDKKAKGLAGLTDPHLQQPISHIIDQQKSKSLIDEKRDVLLPDSDKRVKVTGVKHHSID